MDGYARTATIAHNKQRRGEAVLAAVRLADELIWQVGDDPPEVLAGASDPCIMQG